MSPETAEERAIRSREFEQEFFDANPGFGRYLLKPDELRGKALTFTVEWFDHPSGLKYRGSMNGSVIGIERMEMVNMADQYVPRLIVHVDVRKLLAFPLAFIAWELEGGWRARLGEDSQVFEVPGNLLIY